MRKLRMLLATMLICSMVGTTLKVNASIDTESPTSETNVVATGSDVGTNLVDNATLGRIAELRNTIDSYKIALENGEVFNEDEKGFIESLKYLVEELGAENFPGADEVFENVLNAIEESKEPTEGEDVNLEQEYLDYLGKMNPNDLSLYDSYYVSNLREWLETNKENLDYAALDEKVKILESRIDELNEISEKQDDAVPGSVEEQRGWVFDETSRTIYYSGIAFDRQELLVFASEKGITEENPAKLVLDNPDMVTIEPKSIGLIKFISEVEIKNAKTINLNAFNGFVFSEGANIIVSNVEKICENAFRGSSVKEQINKVSIYDVEEIEKGAFSSRNINEVEVNHVKYLGTRDALSYNSVFPSSSKIKKVSINDVEYFSGMMASPILEEVYLNNIKYLSFRAFYNARKIKKVYMTNVLNVESYAFYNNENLQIFEADGLEYLGADALSKCPNLVTLEVPESVKLGYSDSFERFPDLVERSLNIYPDSFKLSDVEVLADLSVEGYEDSKSGLKNSKEENGSQLLKSARWMNEEKTRAEVNIKMNYSKTPQMDFIFVNDFSHSMYEIGNKEVDADSRFYDLKSKLYNVTKEMLTKDGYDSRIGYVTFGGNAENATFTKQPLTADLSILNNINSLTPYNENTDYVTALNMTLDMIKTEKEIGRNLAVIFISDGQPNYIGSNEVKDMDTQLQEITAVSDQIKALGVEIYGVLESVPTKQQESCQMIMQSLATDGLYFESNDTASFNEAVNEAIAAAYSIDVISDVIDPAFELVEDSIKVNNGSYSITENEEGNSLITWTYYGMPFTTYDMTYELKLKKIENEYPVGLFDTNEGNAVLTQNDVEVNEVETPVLSREKEETPPTPPVDPRPDPTPDPEPEEPEEEIEEEETPETGGEEEEIEEETTPEVGGDEEEIEEEATPEVGNKDEVTDTGVASTLPWLFGLMTSAIVAVAELFRRKK